MIDIGSVDSIDRMIAEFRYSITQREDLGQEVIYKGSILRRALFDPLRPFLNKTKDLIIAPDGEISTLPFQAIPSGKDSTSFLIDDYHIMYISTARDLLRFNPTMKHGSDALVAADPDFDLNTNKDIMEVNPIKVETVDSNGQDR
jgi:CHAT domain-containing protein